MKNPLSLNQKRYKQEADLLLKVEELLDVEKVLHRDLMYTKIRDIYNSGISDVLICVHGIFVAAELKADCGEATVQQTTFIDNVISAGGIGGVCYTVSDVANLIREARERSDVQQGDDRKITKRC